LTNQEIFDLAMRKKVEEENVILEKEEEIISNKDAFLSIEKLYLSILNKKMILTMKILMI
jgi:hypothetical protein